MSKYEEMRNTHPGILEPMSSHRLAEKNTFHEYDICKKDPLWDYDELSAVIGLCKYIEDHLPDAARSKLPGLSVFPGSNYIAIGGPGYRDYQVIRGNGELWEVRVSTEREVETGGGPKYHRPSDAVKEIFLRWFREYFTDLDAGQRLFPEKYPDAEVIIEKFDWSVHRNLFKSETLRSMAQFWYLNVDHEMSSSPQAFFERVFNDFTICRSISDPDSWYITDLVKSDLIIDLRWGLGVDPITYMDRIVVAIGGRAK